MADNNRDPRPESQDRGANATNDDLNRQVIGSEDADAERERVRSSNDRDQELEREDIPAPHNRGYDEAVRGAQSRSTPTDPDSAFSEVDRDDTVDGG